VLFGSLVIYILMEAEKREEEELCRIVIENEMWSYERFTLSRSRAQRLCLFRVKCGVNLKGGINYNSRLPPVLNPLTLP